MIKGAIFDLDGTLLDSTPMWYTIGKKYLAGLGKEAAPGLDDTIHAMSLYQAACYLRDEYGLNKTAGEIMADINNMISSFYFEELELKEGAAEFIRYMAGNGIKMCIATATDRPYVEAALTRCGIREYFSEILTCTEVGHGKDEPHIFRKGLEILGTERENTLVFEDSCYAVLTAAKDGFRVIGIYDSQEKRQEEIKANTEKYIKDFSEFRLEKMKTALSIAGSDCSGGAGIQADLKTMTMNGVYGMSAVTALTAQNTTGVTGIMEVTPDFLAKQIDMIFMDIPPHAVKIGMVASAPLIRVIAERLRFYKAVNIVVDPVMVATSGSSLLESDAVVTMKKELLPLADLVTPNIPEAEVLSGMSIKNKEDMEKAAEKIALENSCAVLLKGGHSISDADDLLFASGKKSWFRGRRIDNPNTHGTGCTLSSAIASNLAKGYSMEESVQRSKDYISDALAAMLDLGAGSGPLNHLFDLKGKYGELKT